MTIYKMRQHLFAIRDAFTIEDSYGRAAFQVDGTMLSLRETLVLKDMQAHEVATIRATMLSLRKSMEIICAGQAIATVNQAMFSLFSSNFTITLVRGEQLEVQGNILDSEYEIRRNNRVIAHISRLWFTLSDTYGIDIAPDEDVGLILAVAVAIDEMVRDSGT